MPNAAYEDVMAPGKGPSLSGLRKAVTEAARPEQALDHLSCVLMIWQVSCVRGQHAIGAFLHEEKVAAEVCVHWVVDHLHKRLHHP